ncbi:MAG: sodium:proton antiporter [Gordonia sp. (in: high G+C Gram-positive bacteria)]|uniref:cation:proton antiporter n=1 Tax=Gordonia sp. (in: high G+C Gram-positive bacteria) TaxID=84139 RepID=UPI0039E6C86B
MTELLVVLTIAFLLIAFITTIGPKLGIASPLLLVIAGVAASYLPYFRDFHLEPELILQGVLPPLLYAAAVSMPAMNFRRELGPISGLSVLLVIISTVGLGLFFMWTIPDLGFAWGAALGAVISPTDAVATSIIKQTSVSKRVVAILEGESLLNDGSALVLLRTAIAATVASFSFWGTLGSFLYSVVVAIAIGIAIGMLNLKVRRHVSDSTVNTVISFTVPFLAAVPAEELGASGLVAAVVAGLVTGYRQPRMLSPTNRLSDAQNWRTVELVLESGVFLTMGLQIRLIIHSVEDDHQGVLHAVVLALIALALTLLLRAAYVAPLLAGLTHRAKRYARIQPRMEDMHEKFTTPEGKEEVLERMTERQRRQDEKRARRNKPEKPRRTRRNDPTEVRLERFTVRLRRQLADIDYFLNAPLGWREGAVVVWAGMRGAVTVAAAQTLPDDAPYRSALILIAYTVAAASLLIQGGTIGPLLNKLTPTPSPEDLAEQQAQEDAEVAKVHKLLRDAATSVPAPQLDDDTPRMEQFIASKQHRIDVIEAQRNALLDARDDGLIDADILKEELVGLDAGQIAMELRGGSRSVRSDG